MAELVASLVVDLTADVDTFSVVVAALVVVLADVVVALVVESVVLCAVVVVLTGTQVFATEL